MEWAKGSTRYFMHLGSFGKGNLFWQMKLKNKSNDAYMIQTIGVNKIQLFVAGSERSSSMNLHVEEKPLRDCHTYWFWDLLQPLVEGIIPPLSTSAATTTVLPAHLPVVSCFYRQQQRVACCHQLLL